MKKEVAIVTGASKGIGAATAILLAKNNFNVVIVYKSSMKEAQAVLKECNNHSNCILIKTDVTKNNDCKKVITTTVKKLGNINILVNNAGKTKFVDFQNLEGLSEKDFLDIYKTNVISIFHMVRACKQSLLKTKEPKIINVS